METATHQSYEDPLIQSGKEAVYQYAMPLYASGITCFIFDTFPIQTFQKLLCYSPDAPDQRYRGIRCSVVQNSGNSW